MAKKFKEIMIDLKHGAVKNVRINIITLIEKVQSVQNKLNAKLVVHCHWIYIVTNLVILNIKPGNFIYVIKKT